MTTPNPASARDAAHRADAVVSGRECVALDAGRGGLRIAVDARKADTGANNAATRRVLTAIVSTGTLHYPGPWGEPTVLDLDGLMDPLDQNSDHPDTIGQAGRSAALALNFEHPHVPRDGANPIADNPRLGVARVYRAGSALMAEARFLNNATAKSIIDDADDGYPFAVSLGYTIHEHSFAGPGAIVNGQPVPEGTRIAHAWSIDEVSLCHVGADRGARVLAVASRHAHASQTTTPNAGATMPDTTTQNANETATAAAVDVATMTMAQLAEMRPDLVEEIQASTAMSDEDTEAGEEEDTATATEGATEDEDEAGDEAGTAASATLTPAQTIAALRAVPGATAELVLAAASAGINAEQLTALVPVMNTAAQAAAPAPPAPPNTNTPAAPATPAPKAGVRAAASGGRTATKAEQAWASLTAEQRAGYVEAAGGDETKARKTVATVVQFGGVPS